MKKILNIIIEIFILFGLLLTAAVVVLALKNHDYKIAILYISFLILFTITVINYDL